ncbi:MAG: 50S ribosomal protein L3 N(5)-glutamine methyltransferase [Hyphomicrobiales bacterium]|nr:50S ribosomal protein L3 N(5)-glutamine methyltransferase [Hyphomicrobiales bacterium]
MLPAELVTIRDWLRFAVTQFNRAQLAYGHGTDDAVDEAAFLILAALKLPIDDVNPWLEARLTREERISVARLIEQRVVTRKPAAYLLGEAWLGSYRFHVDERVIVPRSFIAELMLADVEAFAIEAEAVSKVLDLCTGSGCLAILAAHVFETAVVDAVELDAGAIEVARRNVAEYRLEDRVRLHQGDLFTPLSPGRYDLIIANPPYVTDASLAAFPPEHRAEPPLAHAGGADGLDIVRQILVEAGNWLSPDGRLIMEVGAGRRAVEAAFPGVAFTWLDTQNSRGEVLLVAAAQLAGPVKPKASRKARRPA